MYKLESARYFYMVTFEIAPQDEAEFNEIYDTEHIPNILKVDGVAGVIRVCDAERNAAGLLVYMRDGGGWPHPTRFCKA